MPRTVLEKLARGRCFKRRLPRDLGSIPFYVSPDAALRYLRFGNAGFDSGLLAIVREFVKPGMVVWDIGANVGSFTMAAAYQTGPSGQVLAVEPDIWLAGMINRSVQLKQNRRLPIQVLAAAVADMPGVAQFLIAERGRASNALESVGGRSQSGGVRERHPVPLVRLDDLLAVSPAPQLIKIDVEGAEAAVLAGGTQVLHASRPLIYCEVGRDNNATVSRLLREAGYLLVDPSTMPARRRALTTCPFNVLACPIEKAAKLGIVVSEEERRQAVLNAAANSSTT